MKRTTFSHFLARAAAAALLALPYSSRAELPGADLIAKMIISNFDSDRDGSVDRGEWNHGIQESFDDMDRDHDGYITEDEVNALSPGLAEEIGSTGTALVLPLIKKIIFTLDKDNDKRVSRQEFEDGCAVIFKALDTNNDGKLSKAELGELPVKVFSLAR